MHRYALAAVLVLAGTPLLSAADAAADAVGGPGGADLDLAWTLGAHLGVPLGPAVAAGVVIGHANRAGADGLLLLAEPGLSGGSFGIGYADIDGAARGPYLVDQWHDWAQDHGFLWVTRGWSLRGVLVRGWGLDLGVPDQRTFAGVEGEVIGTIDTGASWGGLHGVNLTAGLLSNVDRVENTPVRRPGDQWRLDLGVGVGF